jgi:hypothetical protein
MARVVLYMDFVNGLACDVLSLGTHKIASLKVHYSRLFHPPIRGSQSYQQQILKGCSLPHQGRICPLRQQEHEPWVRRRARRMWT